MRQSNIFAILSPFLETWSVASFLSVTCAVCCSRIGPELHVQISLQAHFQGLRGFWLQKHSLSTAPPAGSCRTLESDALCLVLLYQPPSRALLLIKIISQSASLGECHISYQ